MKKTGRPPSDFHTELRVARLHAGLSQNELLQAIGLSGKKAADISQAENGHYVKPGLRRKLADFFRVPENCLFNEEGYAR